MSGLPRSEVHGRIEHGASPLHQSDIAAERQAAETECGRQSGGGGGWLPLCSDAVVMVRQGRGGVGLDDVGGGEGPRRRKGGSQRYAAAALVTRLNPTNTLPPPPPFWSALPFASFVLPKPPRAPFFLDRNLFNTPGWLRNTSLLPHFLAWLHYQITSGSNMSQNEPDT